jgi:hypothetical protein
MSSPVHLTSTNAAPTNPFHISRAYQTAVPGAVRGQHITPAERLAAPAQPGAVNQLTNLSARRIVAGIVPGKVDFSGDTPAPAPASLPMYRHPADKNAAATAINAGKFIDIQG